MRDKIRLFSNGSSRMGKSGRGLAIMVSLTLIASLLSIHPTLLTDANAVALTAAARSGADHANQSFCNQDVGSTSSVVSCRTSGRDCVFEFKNTGSTTWTVPAGVTSAKVLIVGGDAGFTEGTIDLANQTSRVFSITVGAGGLRRAHTAAARYATEATTPGGTDGNPSSIQVTDTSNNLSSITANGGLKGAFGSNSGCCSVGSAGGSVSVTDNSATFSYTATMSSATY